MEPVVGINQAGKESLNGFRGFQQRNKFSKYLPLLYALLVLTIAAEATYLFFGLGYLKRKNYTKSADRSIIDDTQRLKIIEAMKDNLRTGGFQEAAVFLGGRVKGVEGNKIDLLFEPRDPLATIPLEIIVDQNVELFYADLEEHDLPSQWEKIEGKKMAEVVKPNAKIAVSQISLLDNEKFIAKAIYIGR